MRQISAFIVLVTLFTAAGAAEAGGPQGTPGAIVSTGWVLEHLQDPRLVLFQVGDRKEYDSLHLPRAQFLSTRDVAKPFVEGANNLELPVPAALDSTLEARGVTDSSIIVIYPGKDWFTPSARIYLTLQWFGLGANAHLMDGGMPAWIAGGNPVTAETAATIAKGSVTARLRDDVIVTKAWVRERLDDPKVAIIDARNQNFYTGQDTGMASRPGHLPGAKNLPFDSLVDSSGFFKKPAELKTLYAAAGLAEGKTSVSYCHIGQQASLVYFVARVLGYDARMYDGSMQEWTRDPDAPLVREAGK
jgi:thiosulfate/3-mercaptopyruvate sulfurtransferase